MSRVTFIEDSYGEQNRPFDYLEREGDRFLARGNQGSKLGYIEPKNITDLDGTTRVKTEDGRRVPCRDAVPTQDHQTGEYGLSCNENFVGWDEIERIE